MNKIWLVFKHEYLRHVKRKRFIMAVLSLPIFIVFIIGVGFLSAYLAIDSRPVAFVDQSGVFANPQQPPQDSGLFSDTPIIPYSDEDSAMKALSDGEVQGVFTVHADYAQTAKITLTSKEALDSDVVDSLQTFLLYNVLSDQPESLRTRIMAGPVITVKTTEAPSQGDANNPFAFIAAIAAGILFIVAINSSGGYLMQAMVEEKENRTMEIILTSLSPTQLMAGKVLGNLSVGLTQILIWIVTAALGLLAFRAMPDASILDINWNFLWVLAATFIPAFIMVAALMAMVGASATEAREAQQIAGLFTLPIVAPLWFTALFIANPNSPLAIGLSLFPLTAPLSLPIRASVTNIPFWQILTAETLLILCAIGAIWIAAKAFRLGLLRYGKKLRLAEILRSARRSA
jgi:ABC-2 type transport system permease protein